MELSNDEISNSDEEQNHEFIINKQEKVGQNKLDINYFNTNYDKMKAEYKTSSFLNKYELTNILSKRSEQIAQGAIPFLKNPEIYSSVYEIAKEELRQGKIPFIIRRPISGNYEYWKLEDLKADF